jgi:hypothetical protein
MNPPPAVPLLLPFDVPPPPPPSKGRSPRGWPDPLPCLLPGRERLEHLAPAPGAVPESGRSQRLPLVPWVLVLPLVMAPLGCARIDGGPSAADGGTVPSVEQVDPPAGAVAASSTFQVTFSQPMDASLLLSDVDQSETVALVPAASAEVMAAALTHSRLTAKEKALLVPCSAQLDAGAQVITLSPAALAPGGYSLLLSPRLKSSDGRKLTGTLRFDYTVGEAAPQPALVSPQAGALAPGNLRVVRFSLPGPQPPVVVGLASADGLVAAAASPADGGTAVIELCPGGRCPALAAGATLSLTVDGAPVDGASFTLDACTRDGPPTLSSSAVRALPAGFEIDAALDWPAQVTAQWAPAPGDALEPDDLALSRLCPGEACRTASALALGVTQGCAPLPSDALAEVQLSLSPPAAEEAWLLRLLVEDDEGHQTSTKAQRLERLAAQPAVVIDEVMASPPLPAPRSDGEYVELWNPGPGAVETSRLYLQGPDGVKRAAVGGGEAPILASGRRALLVGKSFDPSRYPLPAGLPVLRGTTQRLLGRGLIDDGSEAFSLLWQPPAPAGGTAPAPLVLSQYPGAALKCAVGVSFERVHPDPSPGSPAFACGVAGGSPGAAAAP